jgi:hypothetical protein
MLAPTMARHPRGCIVLPLALPPLPHINEMGLRQPQRAGAAMLAAMRRAFSRVRRPAGAVPARHTTIGNGLLEPGLNPCQAVPDASACGVPKNDRKRYSASTLSPSASALITASANSVSASSVALPPQAFPRAILPIRRVPALQTQDHPWMKTV